MQVGLLQELAFAIRNLQRTERCLGDGLGRFQLLFELPYSRFQLKGSACPGGCLAVLEFSPHANDAVLDHFEVVNPYNARIIGVHPDTWISASIDRALQNSGTKPPESPRDGPLPQESVNINAPQDSTPSGACSAPSNGTHP